MLPFWKESPFVRILLPFMAGILLYLMVPSANLLYMALATLILLAALLLFGSRKDFFKLRFAVAGGLLLQLFLLCAAYLTCMLHQIQTSPFWYQHHAATGSFAIGRITAPPEPKEKTLKLTVEIVQLCDTAACVSTCGAALLYLQHHDQNKSLQQGDYILFKNKLQDIHKSGNPGSFDYAAYCAVHHIFQRAFLKADEWRKAPGHRKDPAGFFAKVNARTRAVLKKYIPDKDAHGVAEALLLGYRTDIDDETWQAYTNTGIVHIIAISGMHMAMVYGSARWLFMLWPFFKKRKSIAIMISMLLMWAFACITGLPASVTRAAIMFSFLGLGEMQEQRSNNINILAASAWCMLCFNPMLILDVGFQLSYLAVLSLILFYRPIYLCISVSHIIADRVWKLVAMTLAAQILTLPLCLYYFHQFPLLFVFTNLFAVPLTSVILYFEIVLVVLHFIKPLALLLGKTVSYLVVFVNKTVLHLSDLSFAVWSGIYLTWIQLLLMLFFTGVFTLALFTRKTKPLVIAAMLMFIFCFTLLLRQFEILGQHKLIVYNVQSQSCVEFISQNRYFHADKDSVVKKVNHEVFTLKPAHTLFGLSQSDSTLSAVYKNESLELFSFRGKTIMRLANTHFHADSLLTVDVLIVSGKCDLRAAWLAQQISTRQIVLDSGIPYWKMEALKKELKNTGIPLHIVNEKGAYILNL